MTNEQLAIRIKAGIDVADNMLQLWNCLLYTSIADAKRKGFSGITVRFCEIALELVIKRKKKEEGIAV